MFSRKEIEDYVWSEVRDESEVTEDSFDHSGDAYESGVLDSIEAFIAYLEGLGKVN